MTETQRRVLIALSEYPMLPDELYPIISPAGRFIGKRDPGSSKGGPSRREYAANNYMGRLQANGWVMRHAFLDRSSGDLAGRWVILAEGKAALRGIAAEVRR